MDLTIVTILTVEVTNTELKNALSSKVFMQLSSTQLAAMSKLARLGVIKVEPTVISA